MLRERLAALLLRLTVGIMLAGHAAAAPESPLAARALCLLAGVLLLAGLFTYAAAIVAWIAVIALHLPLLTAAAKVYMWSMLVVVAAVAVMLWLARWDDFALSRFLPASHAVVLAHRGPEGNEPRLAMMALVLRVALGLDFAAAGLSKFHYDWVGQTVHDFRGSILPSAAVIAFAMALPYVQLISGASLGAGLFTTASAVCVAVTLLLLTVGQAVAGSTLVSLWSMFLYLLPAIAVLVLPRSNRFSLDSLFARRWRRAP